jgi:hypothetical protein
MEKAPIVNGALGKEESSVAAQTAEEEMKGSVKLKSVWVVWEQLERMEKTQKGLGEKEYMENMQGIGEFGDLITFWQCWHTFPQANPGNCFTYYDDEQQTTIQPQLKYMYHL